ncbi:hypothetical protein B566_EDAN004642 [Ephemera danica]|nr:hypothetical protein B566_EDAN004642 [Ephemera danica]
MEYSLLSSRQTSVSYVRHSEPFLKSNFSYVTEFSPYFLIGVHSDHILANLEPKTLNACCHINNVLLNVVVYHFHQSQYFVTSVFYFSFLMCVSQCRIYVHPELRMNPYCFL